MANKWPNVGETDYPEEYGHTVDAARMLLRSLMADISEGQFFAGWDCGIQDFCQFAVDNQAADGVGESEIALLTLLHDLTGGWWVWVDDGPVFVESRDV